MFVRSFCFLSAVWRAAWSNIVPPHCNGHGATTPEDDGFSCTCMSGYHGPDCSQRQCPHGTAWVDFPTATDQAHADGVECSGVGYCDRSTGTCHCRDIFDGAACERLKCPIDTDGKNCSGHGQCVTMRWAADYWDGLRLVRPNVSYDLWDADKVTGCLCDDGYSGFSCSQLDCPRGDIPETSGQQNEVIHIECQADSGYFAFSFRGYTSVAIAYDTPYGHLEKYLEDMPSIGDVAITMANYSEAVCGTATPVRTTITFVDDFGDLPAARVVARDLAFNGGSAILKMVTRQVLRCPAGACDSTFNCSGGLYLGYDSSLTSKLSWNATVDDVQQALVQLPTLGAASDFGEINVTVSGSPTLCAGPKRAGQNSNFTIEFRANYGNVYNLSLINSLKARDTGFPVNLTLSAQKGTKENEFCSDRGSCDFTTGTCLCLQLHNLPFSYRYQSSNGYGGKGTRGDCGRVAEPARSCPVAYNSVTDQLLQCAGHGKCDNSTWTCNCELGYYGGDCSLRTCPSGPAWFSEATGPDEAHEPMECSNMGVCERSLGRCICREGFGGIACERMECPTDEDGIVCSGHGRCLPMWRIAELTDYSGNWAGLSYGAATRQAEAQWDSRRVHGCYCDTKDSRQANAGPVSYISGTAVTNPSVGGYTGYDCSRRWCPVGDDITTSGDFEVQTIRCTGSQSSGHFRIGFRRQASRWISNNASSAVVEAALRNMSTIGDVSVSMSNGNSACDSSWRFDTASGMRVTFLSELGDLPMMTTNPAYNVTETVKGTKEDVECANHGYCDYGTGECMCLSGYVGSDGDGNVGTRRDCGRLDPSIRPAYGSTLNPYSEFIS
ncbi:hypothetical protein CTAYLR_006077 [Chrysophaeum taylorii]|uniref:EGF-like domain-containing protein n=1 Tax=Chrysophaeum taylorii TaxID=2483200 RepID=A0AAD7XNF1_9STRA|nr:hypothetical protein CTAYLR_006077 [Chrysophaeum taylorii]